MHVFQIAESITMIVFPNTSASVFEVKWLPLSDMSMWVEIKFRDLLHNILEQY